MLSSLSSPTRTVALAPHPETRGNAVRSIAAHLSGTSDDTLSITWVIEGELDRVRVPAQRPPRMTDGLWQHTCCEIFIARHGAGARYHEYNLSPSGEWALYAFERYRQRAPLLIINKDSLDPKIVVRRTTEKLELDALIPLGHLLSRHANSPLLLGLSVVIEDQDGLLSYWALRHPPGKPDFHHADAFALEIE